jgi:hypothetical protein
MVVGSYRLVPPSFYKAALRYTGRPPPRFALVPAAFHYELGNKLYVQLSPNGWKEEPVGPAAVMNDASVSEKQRRQALVKAALMTAQVSKGLPMSKVAEMKRAQVMRAIQTDAGIVAGVNAQIAYLQHTLAVNPRSEGSLRSLAAYAQSHRPELVPECLRMLADVRKAMGARAPLTLRYLEFHMRQERMEMASAAGGANQASSGSTGTNSSATSTEAVVARLAKRRHARLAKAGHADALEAIRLLFRAVDEAQHDEVPLTAALERGLFAVAGKALEAVHLADEHFEPLLAAATPSVLRGYAAYVREVHMDIELSIYYLYQGDLLENSHETRAIPSRLSPLSRKALQSLKATSKEFEQQLNDATGADDLAASDSESSSDISFSGLMNTDEVHIVEDLIDDLQAHCTPAAHGKLNRALIAIFAVVFVVFMALHWVYILQSLDTFSAGTFAYTLKDAYALLSSLHAAAARLLLLGSPTALRHFAASLRHSALGMKAALRVDAGAAFTNSTIIAAQQAAWGVADPADIPDWPVPELASSWLPGLQALRAQFLDAEDVSYESMSTSALVQTASDVTIYDGLIHVAADAALLGSCVAAVADLADGYGVLPLQLLLQDPLHADVQAAAEAVSLTCVTKAALADLTISVLANSTPVAALPAALRELVATCAEVVTTDPSGFVGFVKFFLIMLSPVLVGFVFLRQLLFRSFAKRYQLAVNGLTVVFAAPAQVVFDLADADPAVDDFADADAELSSVADSVVSLSSLNRVAASDGQERGALAQVAAQRDIPFSKLISHVFWTSFIVTVAVAVPSLVFSFVRRNYYSLLLSVLASSVVASLNVSTAEAAAWSLSALAATPSGVPTLPVDPTDQYYFGFNPEAIMGDALDVATLLATTSPALLAAADAITQAVVTSPVLEKVAQIRFHDDSFAVHRAALGLADLYPPENWAFSVQRTPRAVFLFYSEAILELASSSADCASAGPFDVSCAERFAQSTAGPGVTAVRHAGAAYAVEALFAEPDLSRHPALDMLLETSVDVLAVCSEVATPLVTEVNAATSEYYVILVLELVALAVVVLLFRFVLLLAPKKALSMQARAALLLEMVLRRNKQLLSM